MKLFGPGSYFGSASTLALPDPAPCLTGKVCFITGANSGIGFETAIWFVKQGATVVFACRSKSRAEKAIEEIVTLCPASKERLEFIELDLSDLNGVRACVARWKERSKTAVDQGRINFLINNAGSMFQKKTISPSGFEMMFQVNHLSHFILTLELLPYIRLAEAPFARIINVSSVLSFHAPRINLDQLNSEDIPDSSGALTLRRSIEVYGRTKLMNIIFTKELARRLTKSPAHSHIVTHALHPGLVATNFSSDAKFLEKASAKFGRTPAQGAMGTIYTAASKEAGTSNGLYWSDCVPATPPKSALDEQFAGKFWEKSLQLAGVDLDSEGGRI